MRLLICGGIFVEEITGHRRLGGSGLTAALAAAHYGTQVSLAGWVGAAEADEAFALLDAADVDRLGVQVLTGPTTTYRIADPQISQEPSRLLLIAGIAASFSIGWRQSRHTYARSATDLKSLPNRRAAAVGAAAGPSGSPLARVRARAAAGRFPRVCGDLTGGAGESPELCARRT